MLIGVLMRRTNVRPRIQSKQSILPDVFYNEVAMKLGQYVLDVVNSQPVEHKRSF